MILIGITGTLGAGKGTVVDFLIENYGFKHYSVRGFLTEEIEKNTTNLKYRKYFHFKKIVSKP